MKILVSIIISIILIILLIDIIPMMCNWISRVHIGRYDNEEVWSEKAIIFNNIPTTRVSGFLDGLKKMKIRRPLTAMVTEVSIDWKLDTLIYNLKEERKSIAKGQVVDHSK